MKRKLLKTHLLKTLIALSISLIPAVFPHSGYHKVNKIVHKHSKKENKKSQQELGFIDNLNYLINENEQKMANEIKFAKIEQVIEVKETNS